MIDEARRAEIADGLRQLLGTSATCIVPYREVVEEFVRRLMDAVGAEIRAELAPRGDAAGPESRATPAPEGVTCQCRNPEAYSNAELGAIICNQCGYKLTTEEERAKMPPRAPRRDFGPHVCLCDYSHTRDGKTCIQCHGTLAPFSPGPTPGGGLKPVYQMSEHGE